jgi:hypothetical protein
MITTEAPRNANAPSQPRSGASRYTRIFAIALSVVTIAALAVAYFSSDFHQSGSSALPASWSQAYSADLTTTNDGAWDESQGCRLTALGLDAAAPSATDALCVFQPSVNGSVTSAGFFFTAKLAPAANVPSFARAILSIGPIDAASASASASVRFTVGQDGSYTLCDGVCGATGGGIYLHGGLASWHGDALVPNTIAVKVTPTHDTLTIFANGQEVATVNPQLGAQPAIVLGAPAGSEAIFSQATLYTGQ